MKDGNSGQKTGMLNFGILIVLPQEYVKENVFVFLPE